MLAQFQRMYPGIHISIKYGNSQQVMKWLETQNCDVAVLPNVPEDDRFHIIKLDPDQLVAFVSLDHPWAQRRTIKLQEMVEQRVILREVGSKTRAIFEQALEDAGIEASDVMEISSREGVREAVAAGFGIGIVSENELGSGSRFQALQISNARLTNTEYVVCLKHTRSVQVTTAFLDMIS
jgi:DNA-binding transcriptional LysR family regulator